MRIKIITVVALLGLMTLCLVISVHGEENRIQLWQTAADWGGETNQWWLPISRLEKLPKWHSDKREPPISQTSALKIARKWIASKGVSGTNVVDYILLQGVSPQGGSHQFDYYYRIRFGNVNAYLNHMTCIVLMDGAVLEPELAK